MNKKRWIATGVFAAIVMMQIFLLPITVGSLFPGTTDPIRDHITLYQEGKEDGIAYLRLDGIILNIGESPFSVPGYQHRRFLRQLEVAFSDPRYKAVVLYVNSPGGGIYESDEIYQTIKELQEEHNKPYVVYMSRIAASGGYYVSAPADAIVANRNTITGSIGVVISGLNVSELLERYGIRDQTISSGENKTILSPYQEMRPDQRSIIQSIIDESYGYFVDVVAEGRGMDTEEVLSLADGRIYSGQQALDLGLVDQLGSLDTAFSLAAEKAGISDPNIYQFRNQPAGLMLRLFAAVPGAGHFFDHPLQPMITEIIRQDTEGPRPMYLYEW